MVCGRTWADFSNIGKFVNTLHGGSFWKISCNSYVHCILGYFYHVDAEAPGCVSFKIRCNYCSSFIIQWYLCIILVPFFIPGMLLRCVLVSPPDRQTL